MGGVPGYRVGRIAGKRERQKMEGKGDRGIEEKSKKGCSGGSGGFHRHTLIDSNELVLVAVAAESDNLGSMVDPRRAWH